MVTAAATSEVQSIEIVLVEQIDAPAEVVFESILARLGPEAEVPGGKPFPMTLEAWPGGRWFRDLGDNTGHFWAHVQVIKPPTLLELYGPMFLSYAAVSHVQYRLTPAGSGTQLTLTHKVIGAIPAEFRTGMGAGWKYGLQRIRERAEGPMDK